MFARRSVTALLLTWAVVSCFFARGVNGDATDYETTGKDQYCTNRGSQGGKGQHSWKIRGGISDCARKVYESVQCGRAFSYGRDGWCDCVPAEDDDTCKAKQFGSYSTYLLKAKMMTQTTTTITRTTTSNTESMQLARHMQDMIDEALASAGEFADKKVVVDLAKTLETVEVAFEQEVSKRIAQSEAAAASLAQQNSQLMAVIAQQAADAKGERDVLFGHIYTMTRRLNALEGAAQVEEVAENADPSGCGAAAAGCPAEIVANDASASSSDRTVTVRGGQVLFESDKCAATDLCELQNKVQALMNKFNGTGLV